MKVDRIKIIVEYFMEDGSKNYKEFNMSYINIKQDLDSKASIYGQDISGFEILTITGGIKGEE